MRKSFEGNYPIGFRAQDAQTLAKHLMQRNSVSVIGMKRVGINNFLRFFLYHPQIRKTYFTDGSNHLFIRIDLNDLVERDIYPFWTLTLKRIVDTVERSIASEELKKQCKRLFTESIQLKDLFFTVDSVQKIVASLVSEELFPTFFLLRFDRLKDVIGHEFFDNLQGLNEAAQHKLSYVFTTFRPLHELSPDVFKKSSLSIFSHTMYIKGAQYEDSSILFDMFCENYNVKVKQPIKESTIELSGGHAQYLQLAAFKLQEVKNNPKDRDTLFSILTTDEQIILQSEELFASLSKGEKEILLKVRQGKSVSAEEQKQTSYLWNTGIIIDTKKSSLFSPLFGHYLTTVSNGKVGGADFTKKEHLLFTFLKSRQGELCERDDIIHAVWPEQEETGVSDWAIDRLVARVRGKLKTQNSPFEIVTVITRGYKLVGKS